MFDTFVRPPLGLLKSRALRKTLVEQVVSTVATPLTPNLHVVGRRPGDR